MLGRAGITCALLLKGAGVNALDSQGRTPLHLATENGQHRTVEALLIAGADATLRCQERDLSALDLAASHGNIEVLGMMIKHGVDVNDADCTGYTALHLAADNNQASAVHALVEAGADIQSLDLHGWTPLHCASRLDSGEAMLALLRCGAKVHARGKAGEYPLHVAAWYLTGIASDLLLR